MKKIYALMATAIAGVACASAQEFTTFNSSERVLGEPLSIQQIDQLPQVNKQLRGTEVVRVSRDNEFNPTTMTEMLYLNYGYSFYDGATERDEFLYAGLASSKELTLSEDGSALIIGDFFDVADYSMTPEPITMTFEVGSEGTLVGKIALGQKTFVENGVDYILAAISYNEETQKSEIVTTGDIEFDCYKNALICTYDNWVLALNSSSNRFYRNFASADIYMMAPNATLSYKDGNEEEVSYRVYVEDNEATEESEGGIFISNVAPMNGGCNVNLDFLEDYIFAEDAAIYPSIQLSSGYSGDYIWSTLYDQYYTDMVFADYDLATDTYTWPVDCADVGIVGATSWSGISASKNWFGECGPATLTRDSEEGGIGSAVAEESNAPAVYYNLQGVRVNNPEKGLFIVVKGNKASKVIF